MDSPPSSACLTFSIVGETRALTSIRVIRERMSVIVRMVFHFTSLLADVILKLPHGCVESVTDRHMHVFVFRVPGFVVADGNVSARNRNVNVDLIETTPVLMMVRRVHHDVATQDSVVETFEP